MSAQDIDAIKTALSAGPTPGPWRQEHKRCIDGMYRTLVFDSAGDEIAHLMWHPVPVPGGTSTDRAENAAYIAACHPQAIAALLDALEAAQKDAARYRWLRANACWGYPSSEGSSSKDAYLVITGYGVSGNADAAIDAVMNAKEPT